jgi:selenide,water dikinase
MITLNRTAAEVLERAPAGVVHACTDVTGFGLIGHGSEMARASGCSLEIDASRLPVLDGARELSRGNNPGGARTNREHFGPGVHAFYTRVFDHRVVPLLMGYDPLVQLLHGL